MTIKIDNIYSYTWTIGSVTRLVSDRSVVWDPSAAAYHDMHIYGFLIYIIGLMNIITQASYISYNTYKTTIIKTRTKLRNPNGL